MCIRDSSQRSIRVSNEKKVQWIGDPIMDQGQKTYYRDVLVGEDRISVGDCVVVEPSDPKTPLFVGKVISMWQDNKLKEKMFHVHWFW